MVKGSSCMIDMYFTLHPEGPWFNPLHLRLKVLSWKVMKRIVVSDFGELLLVRVDVLI